MDQLVPTPANILARAKAIRLPLPVLAKAAGKHPNTLKKLAKREGREHRSTLEAVDTALTAEERRQLEHLLGRFGKADLAGEIFDREQEAVAA